MVYLNESTGEDLWEPPASGYTKHDGSLVLASGEIAEDPDVLEARELEKRKWQRPYAANATRELRSNSAEVWRQILYAVLSQ